MREQNYKGIVRQRQAVTREISRRQAVTREITRLKQRNKDLAALKQTCDTRVKGKEAEAKRCQDELAQMQAKEKVPTRTRDKVPTGGTTIALTSQTAKDHQLYRYKPCMEMCLGLLNGTSWGFSPSSKVMDFIGKSTRALGRVLDPDYVVHYREGQKTTTQRCEFVCKQPYRDSDSCGGVTLGLPERKWEPTSRNTYLDQICCSRSPSTGFLNNGGKVYSEYVETQSIPPPTNRGIIIDPPNNPPPAPDGTLKNCPIYKLDVCNPSAMERSICVKRWDGLKKMQVASKCRGETRKARLLLGAFGRKPRSPTMETFVYSHLLVKVSACKLTDREKACVVDLRKEPGCQGKTLPWNQVSEAKCKAGKTGVTENTAAIQYDAKDFEQCRYAGSAMIGNSTTETPRPPKQSNRYRRESPRYKWDDEYEPPIWANRMKGKWRNEILKKIPTLDCQVKSKSRVYRICWCDDPKKCEGTADPKVDPKHCMIFDEKSGKWPDKSDGQTAADRCLNGVATTWLESGSLQGMDMVQW